MSYSGGAAQSSRSKWSTRFPVYQIDFTAVASGKRVATSKRRVRWRFGFSNKEALEAGETGTACRGEEHDVTVVWSVTSGKRLILADGQEVHYSTVRSGIFEFSWTMRGNHVLKVVAHAAPQINPTPGFRQYDLNVDGQSFFVMPKVYELGIRGPISSHAPQPGVVNHNHPSPSPREATHGYYDLNKGQYVQNKLQEETDLQKAIQESIQESRKHLNQSTNNAAAASATNPATVVSDTPKPHTTAGAPPAAAGDVDLLDMMGGMSVANTPTPTGYDAYGGNPYGTQPQTPYATQQAYAPAPALVNTAAPAYHTAPATTYAPAPATSYDPQMYAAAYHANQPQYQASTPYPTNPPEAAPTVTQAPDPAPAPPVTDAPEPAAATTTTAPSTEPTGTTPSTDPVMNKLVNFDNIRAPANPNNQQGSQFSNVFADPAKPGAAGDPQAAAGPKPSLSEMQSSKPNTNKQEVMSTNYATNTNALVATGTQPGYGVQLPQAYTQNQQAGYGAYAYPQQQQQTQTQAYGYPQQQQQQQQQQYYGQYAQQYGGYPQPQQPPSYG